VTTIAHLGGVRAVVGVDTHKDEHVAVAIDGLGVRLGEHRLRARPAGYAGLERWAASMGEIAAFGVEGTGSFGAGLARFLSGRGHTVIEVSRPDRFPTASGQTWQERSHRRRGGCTGGPGWRSPRFTEVRHTQRRDDSRPEGSQGLSTEGPNTGHEPDEGVGPHSPRRRARGTRRSAGHQTRPPLRWSAARRRGGAYRRSKARPSVHRPASPATECGDQSP